MRNSFGWVVSLMTLWGVPAGGVCAETGKYLGPSVVVASKDGASLLVLNRDARQVAVVETAGGKVARTIALPAQPTGMALSPDGGTLYVTCVTPLGTVYGIDIASGRTTATIPAGHYAGAPVASPDGKRLYVCNRFDNNISVIDLESKKEIARIPAVREPIAAAITPDGRTLVVANHLPNDRSDGYDVAAVVQLIDTAGEERTAENGKRKGEEGVEASLSAFAFPLFPIRLPNGSTGVRGVCVSPDGKYAYVTHILARYQMPTTQLERGWMNTNALSIVDVPGKRLINTVLLDDVDLGAAVPWGVAASADGKLVCVAHASTHELSVIDMPSVLEKLSKIPKEAGSTGVSPVSAAKPGKMPVPPAGKANDDRGIYSSSTQADVPNDLAFLVDLRRRVSLRSGGPWGGGPISDPSHPMANGPRGAAIVGSKAYVSLYFSDNLAVVDLSPKAAKLVSWIALGPTPKLTMARRGEMFFHDADLCFQHWQSCASCHPDARVDGLNWDLLNDGLGNPKNNKSMLYAHRTPPSMWEGVRPNAEDAVRSGIRNIQFAVRPEEDAVAIDEYLRSLRPVPSPHLVDGRLSESAQRGKTLFFSPRVGCGTCHPEPLYTDLKMHDVESKARFDRRGDFDTPSLVECWRTAPYLHDGHWTTVKKLIQEGKHGRKHGEVEKLTEREVEDLAEFVLSL